MQRIDVPSPTSRRQTLAFHDSTVRSRLSLFAGVAAMFFLSSVCPIAAAARSFVPLQASTGHPTRSSGLTAALRHADATIARMTRQELFSGSVLVASHGNVLLSKGYGMADRKRHIPNNTQTQYRIGTTTNQFTAMAVLLLQATGKLDVRDHICSYVARCPTTWHPITIHELLTQTSGMDNFPARSDPSKPTSPAQLLAAARATPLIDHPGSGWSYSNLGYDVLGYIAEKVSHQSYGSYLRARIFAPAHMSSSAYFETTRPTKLAVGYADAFSTSYHVQMSNAFSSAGVYSTVGDLYRWDAALAKSAVAPSALVTKVFTPYVTVCLNNCVAPPDSPELGYKTPVAQDAYGYGWGIARLRRSHHRLYGAAGGFSGGLAFNGRYPDDKVTIIVLTNQDDVDIARVVALLERAVLRKQ